MPSNVFVENVEILSEHLKQVTNHIKAGRTADAAEALKAIGDAARWLGDAVTARPRPPLPPAILPGKACHPTLRDVSKAGSPK